jgi:hypothetical protein
VDDLRAKVSKVRKMALKIFPGTKKFRQYTPLINTG